MAPNDGVACLRHPFTNPPVRPEMIRRWNNRTSSRQGSTATIAAAARRLGGGCWLSAPGKFWMPVISRVIGTAFRLPRMTANRNSFQVPIRIRMRGRGHPRASRRDRHPEQRAEAGAAVDPGRLLERDRDVHEEVAQQPDDQRQPERDVDDHQRRDRVGQADDLEDPQDRDRHDDGRHHLDEDEQGQDRGLAA